MNEYQGQELSELTFEELLSHLYYLGTFEVSRMSYEMDDLEEATEETKTEILRRYNDKH